MQNVKKIPGQGQFDQVNSTYKHIIYLAPGQKRSKLDGYSKGLYLSESADKTYVLIQFIQRIFRSGYFDSSRVQRIEYFRNNHDGLGYTDFILILEPKTFHFTGDLELVNNQRFTDWLRKFYGMINKGIVDQAALAVKPERIEEKDVFSLTYRRFNTEQELLNHCHKCGTRKYPQGMIDNFYLKYREKYPFYPTSDALQELASHFKSL